MVVNRYGKKALRIILSDYVQSKLLFFPNPLPPGSKADLPYEIQPPFEVYSTYHIQPFICSLSFFFSITRKIFSSNNECVLFLLSNIFSLKSTFFFRSFIPCQTLPYRYHLSRRTPDKTADNYIFIQKQRWEIPVNKGLEKACHLVFTTI